MTEQAAQRIKLLTDLVVDAWENGVWERCSDCPQDLCVIARDGCYWNEARKVVEDARDDVTEDE